MNLNNENWKLYCPFNLKNNNVSCFISIIGDTFIEGNFNEKYLKAAQRKLVEISLEEALND